jgi:hypothetical protein
MGAKDIILKKAVMTPCCALLLNTSAIHGEREVFDPFPKNLLVDQNCASFLLAVLEKHSYQPSTTRKCLAALRSALVHHGIPTWEHTHHWPLVSEVKKKNERYLKEHNYFPQQSTEITFAAICEGTALEFGQCEDILMHTVFAVLGATGKRVDDLYEMYSSEMKKVPAQASFPRHFRFCQLQSKGDPTGNGPEAARTTLLLCNCVQMLETAEERRYFSNKLTEDPDCACCVSCCPYRVFVKYLSLIPDPFGEQLSKKNEKKRVFRSVFLCHVLFFPCQNRDFSRNSE